MFNLIISSILPARRLPSFFAALLVSFFVASHAFAGEPAPGAYLTIPALDLNASIVTIPLNNAIGTWDTSRLGASVGHFEYTPWLGEAGNIVLGGHSTDTEGAPSIFYRLDDVAVGDTILVSQGTASVEYVVTQIRYVAISDVSVLYPTSSDTVTLITCAGYNRDTQTYDQRLVVTAERIG